jgi:hypothetical protein
MFAESVGANPTFNPVSSKLTWSSGHDPQTHMEVGPPTFEVDREMRSKIRKAKATPLPKEEDLISILAGVRETTRAPGISSSIGTPKVASPRLEVGLTR